MVVPSLFEGVEEIGKGPEVTTAASYLSTGRGGVERVTGMGGGNASSCSPKAGSGKKGIGK